VPLLRKKGTAADRFPEPSDSAACPEEVYVSGLACPPAPPRRLRAGPLFTWFDAGGLRYLGTRDVEAVRGIYAAVRDRNWDTIPGELKQLEIFDGGDSFRISFLSAHLGNGIDFVFQANIRGLANGTVIFGLEGEARSTFYRNRIGFCVLHPAEACGGLACLLRHTNGETEALRFPTLIAPTQPVAGFRDLQAMVYPVEPEVWAEAQFEGDVFEMEDQRNWIDASFKTYCTALSVPTPVLVRAGTKVRQEITVRLIQGKNQLVKRWPAALDPEKLPRLPDEAEHPAGRATPAIAYGFDYSPGVTIETDLRAPGFRLPEVGLQVSQRPEEFEEANLARPAQRLRSLGLAHLRADLRLTSFEWRLALTTALREAIIANVPLELAIHLPAKPSDVGESLAEVSKLLEKLATGQGATARTKRLLILCDGQKSTTRESLDIARKQLARLNIPIGAGTDADLYQINLEPPPFEAADFIFWSMNPQTHAFDNTSIAEAPAVAAQQVQSAKRYFPGKAICISPVTLKPRFNPVATAAAAAAGRDELPNNVDVRQVSLFGAGWTLAMFKHLAQAGVASMTFYETCGWRGVLENRKASLWTSRFPSWPDSVFPVFHTLADIAGFAEGLVVRSSRPTVVEALGIRRASGLLRMLLANLSGSPQHVALKMPFEHCELVLLHHPNVVEAMRQPEAWRERPRIVRALRERLEVPAYSLLRLDFHEAGPTTL